MDLSTAMELAVRLMAQHGVEDWHFEFDNAKKRAGSCNYRERKITLSRALTQIWPDDEVRDTILHEIAHAIAGPRADHGPEWRDVARKVGARPEARYNGSDLPQVEGTWVATCKAGHVRYRHRRPTRPVSCGECSRKYDPDNLLNYVRNVKENA